MDDFTIGLVIGGFIGGFIGAFLGTCAAALVVVNKGEKDDRI